MQYILYILFINFLLSNPQDYAKKSDNLNLNGKYNEELVELNNAILLHPNNVDILWRIARAHFEIADQTDNINIHKKHFYPGFKAVESAVRINPNSSKANHWYAVLVGKIGMLEGTEQKIKNSYEVEKYALKAIELDPSYDGTYHVMGRWHYELANLSWFERKIAEWVYTTPPNGGYEQAIFFLKKAINVKDDEIRHYFWLAKTYLKMSANKEAEKIFKKILTLTPFDNSDVNMQSESKVYLENI